MPVFPCTELEFSTFIGPIFPTGGLPTQGDIEDFWQIIEVWVSDEFGDAIFHGTVGDSLVPTITSPSDLISKLETIANTAYPGINCWAEPVQEGG